jgi:hypothetical protein
MSVVLSVTFDSQFNSDIKKEGKMKNTLIIFLLGFVLTITSLMSTTSAQQYYIIDLGTLGGSMSRAQVRIPGDSVHSFQSIPSTRYD